MSESPAHVFEPQYFDALDLAFAHGGPLGTGRLKVRFEDFFVDECLGFECTGEGEHLYVRIEKRGLNTEAVARRLARFAGVARREVAFAGLKDRHAVARQWFSVRLPKIADGDFVRLSDQELKVIDTRRHLRKLKRGALAANRFQIRIRELKADPDELAARLNEISTSGVPNYFGPQRFGRACSNLSEALLLFEGSEKIRDRAVRGILISAARSFLFNRILAGRVEDKIWNRAIDGDVLMFDRSNSYFRTLECSEDDLARVMQGELHPTAVLWGKGQLETGLEARELECRVLRDYPRFCDGLESLGVEPSRRPLRMFPGNLSWRFRNNQELHLEFELPAGGYATSVIRELLSFNE